MERLTWVRDLDGMTDVGLRDGVTVSDAICRLAALERVLGDEYDLGHLREMVQAEQDERLVVLPCYTGDKVYIPFLGKILELEVGSIVLNGGVTAIYYYSSSVRSSPEDFGKNVFLTRKEAEAEAALEVGTDEP